LKEVSSASDIIVGRDGVVLIKEGHSAVFLPQVATEQKWNREELLDNLCRKAGLSAECWRKGAQLSIFQAVVFSEADFK
jgi:AMMECR1 domain-containing protein